MNHNKTVLIVDDVKAIQDSLSLLLSGMGFNSIDCAPNAKIAFEKLSTKPYDIIFLDIELPDSNGKEMLSSITDDYADSQVIMCSGHNTLENVKQTWEMGAKGFISKPFDAKKVETIVRRLSRN
jgi:two-component system chemotaxis response regulator CheY